MRDHENRFRRALIAYLEERIDRLRASTGDSVLPRESYATNVGRIMEAKRILNEIPDIAGRVLKDEDDDDDQS